MTAYGRGMVDFSYGRLTLEIQAVNRRHLEVNISLPRLLNRFEMAIRKKISERIGRGMINVLVNWYSAEANTISVKPNLTLAKGLKSAWEKIALELGFETSINLNLLALEKNILIYEEEIPEENSFQIALDKALINALDHLMDMKQKEGNQLCKDLYERTLLLNKIIVSIELQAPSNVELYRKKLTERIEELFKGSSENEERILREIALFAERIDITEEIVRFKSHITQFQYMLSDPLTVQNETRGRKLDFLLQELNREANTMGQKASDLEISQQVVALKSELEKMREQVQNIE